MSEDPDPEEKRRALERVLGSSELATAPRARDFLRYVVEEEAAGRGDLLKGYKIATEALGRHEAFDADLQSAVRVQAKRLRERLAAYYSGSGQTDPLVIDIPRGAYSPTFARRAAPPADDPAQAQDFSPSGEAVGAEPAWRREPVSVRAPERPTARLVAAALVVAALLTLLAAIGARSWLHSGPEDDWNNHISVEAARPFDPALQPVAETFVAALKGRLAEHEDVVIEDAPSGGPWRSFRVEITLYPGADSSASYALSLERQDGTVLYSAQGDTGANGRLIAERAALLAAKIAAPYGLIYADALQNGRKIRRDCVIESFEYFRRAVGDISDIEACLRREIDQRSYIPAMTALSRVYLQEYRYAIKPAGDVDPIAAAEALALRALELGPQKARVFKSLFEVRFFQERFDEAFAAADRAIELNPYAADILYRVGAGRVARGDLEKGKALLDRAKTLNPASPDWMHFYFFLEAFSRSDEIAAARAAEAPGAETTALGLLARAIVAERRKDLAEKQKCMAAMARAFPAVAADLPATLTRFRLTAALQRKLLAALNI